MSPFDDENSIDEESPVKNRSFNKLRNKNSQAFHTVENRYNEITFTDIGNVQPYTPLSNSVVTDSTVLTSSNQRRSAWFSFHLEFRRSDLNRVSFLRQVSKITELAKLVLRHEIP